MAKQPRILDAPPTEHQVSPIPEISIPRDRGLTEDVPNPPAEITFPQRNKRNIQVKPIL